VEPLPSTTDAIHEFNRQLDIITREISFEYTRMFDGNKEEQADKSPRKGHSMAAMSYLTPAQLREQRETKKEKFLADFNSPLRAELKGRLKKAIIRLAVEKH
jgi:hypothetical protein